jgi:DnaJ domain
MVDDTMSMEEAYHLLELKYEASTSDVTKAWKRLVKHWHPDKNGNSLESKEHTQKLNSAKDLLLARAGAHHWFGLSWLAESYNEIIREWEQATAQERKRQEEHKKQEEILRQQREQQELFRKQEYEWECERERHVQAEKDKARANQAQAQMAQKKSQQAEVRRAKARLTQRETNRKEVIIVYNGPDFDQKLVREHLVALKVVRFKGRIVDTEKGTKAVWVMFGRELRRTVIQKAIRKHNLSVDDSLKIRLGLEDPSRHLDEVIICSNDRKRLQNHERFLFIVSGKGQDDSYWESDCYQGICGSSCHLR